MSEQGRILVVDDDPLNRLQLARNLQLQGHTVSLAENGRQALELLHSQDFDLVLLDILMPEMDGFEVLERMHNDGSLRHIPVLVISMLQEMDNVIRCIEMGAEDHLPKPFDATLLKARIGSCLEKKHLREAVVRQLGKYVPESIAEAIIQGRGQSEPMRTQATILYSDIENFTGIAESLSPDQVFQMLNEFFPTVIEPIMRYSGVVNQFQGDAMLVTFNVPLEDPLHADHAVQAAYDMEMAIQNKTFAGLPLRIRIGINTGQVIAGNVGSGNRISYTVHGDAVNLAARLEQLNKRYGTQVLVSGSTVEQLSGCYPLEAIGETPIRGKRETIRVFKLVVQKAP